MSEPVIETAAPFPGVCVALNASPPRATTEKEVLLGVPEVPRLTLPPALIVTAAALPPPWPPSAGGSAGTVAAARWVVELAVGSGGDRAGRYQRYRTARPTASSRGRRIAAARENPVRQVYAGRGDGDVASVAGNRLTQQSVAAARRQAADVIRARDRGNFDGTRGRNRDVAGILRTVIPVVEPRGPQIGVGDKAPDPGDRDRAGPEALAGDAFLHAHRHVARARYREIPQPHGAQRAETIVADTLCERHIAAAAGRKGETLAPREAAIDRSAEGNRRAARRGAAIRGVDRRHCRRCRIDAGKRDVRIEGDRAA